MSAAPSSASSSGSSAASARTSLPAFHAAALLPMSGSPAGGTTRTTVGAEVAEDAARARTCVSTEIDDVHALQQAL